MDYSPPGSSVRGILQARTLEWVANSSSVGSSRPRDRTWVSSVSCIDRRVLYFWATREAILIPRPLAIYLILLGLISSSEKWEQMEITCLIGLL